MSGVVAVSLLPNIQVCSIRYSLASRPGRNWGPHRRLDKTFAKIGEKSPIFLSLLVTPEITCEESIYCEEFKSSDKHKEGEDPECPVGVYRERETGSYSSDSKPYVAQC